MNFENYVYPQDGAPLVEAYGGAFESVFIVLHPFIRVPQPLSWTVSHQYPDDSTILAHGAACLWTEVASQIGLGSCARLNQALLTSIGSLPADVADLAGKNALQKFLQAHPVWMPTEGRFEPLLWNRLLAAFEAARHEELIFIPERPASHPAVRLPVAGMKSGSLPFPGCGTLLAPDASFLLTVDWDSFFTLFYGTKAFVARTAAALQLEGFFATPNTDHAWFNYSMGCATVTLSPEHWQTV